VVGAAFRELGERFFLALRRVASNLGEAGEPQRFVAAATRVHRQDTAWGTSGQLVGGTVGVQVAGIFSAEDGVCRTLNEQLQNPHA